MDKKLSYDELLAQNSNLRKEIIQFSAVKQNLRNTQNRVDQELDRYKRLQYYNSKLVGANNQSRFLLILAEAVVDVLEVEMCAVYLRNNNNSKDSILIKEGFFNDIQDSEIINSFISIDNKNPNQISLNDSLNMGPNLAHIFSQMLFTSIHDFAKGYSLFISGLISNENKSIYNKLDSGHIDIFSIISNHAVSIFSNKLREEQILQQVEVITKSENELKKLSLIATKTSNSVIITDKFGQIEWVNKAFEEVTGFLFDEIVGLKPKDFLHGEKTEAELAAKIGDKLTRKESVSLVITNYKKSGELYFNHLEITPILNANNQITNYISVQRDITSLVKLQNKLQNAISERDNSIIEIEAKNEELVKINHELDNFVYSISHDLRSPLTSVKGIFSLLRMDEKLSTEGDNLLGMAEKSVNRLDDTIQDILNYSRNARLEIIESEFSLKQLLDDIIDDVKFASRSSIDFIINYTGNEILRADKSRLSILLKNLIGNSAKYTRDDVKSFIKVSVNNSEKTLEVEIEDNGMGIKEEYLDRIFNMFFRGTNKGAGTGLGLYICKEIVNKLHGTLDLDTIEEKGTTITFKIPLAIGL